MFKSFSLYPADLALTVAVVSRRHLDIIYTKLSIRYKAILSLSSYMCQIRSRDIQIYACCSQQACGGAEITVCVCARGGERERASVMETPVWNIAAAHLA